MWLCVPISGCSKPAFWCPIAFCSRFFLTAGSFGKVSCFLDVHVMQYFQSKLLFQFYYAMESSRIVDVTKYFLILFLDQPIFDKSWLSPKKEKQKLKDEIWSTKYMNILSLSFEADISWCRSVLLLYKIYSPPIFNSHAFVFLLEERSKLFFANSLAFSAIVQKVSKFVFLA